MSLWSTVLHNPASSPSFADDFAGRSAISGFAAHQVTVFSVFLSQASDSSLSSVEHTFLSSEVLMGQDAVEGEKRQS
jgi:hypothetical protein